MLVLYSRMLFFPGGNPATEYPVAVHLRASNQTPPLFADAGATLPLSSPVTTDEDGTLRFYAAPGYYTAEIAGEHFDVWPDPSHTDPVRPDLWTHTQASPSAVWTIDHFFGTRPEVQILSGSAETEAEVSHPSVSQTVITFGAPTTGTAQLRR